MTTTTEWRACWRDWRRTLGGKKKTVTIHCNAVSEEQARKFIEFKDRPDITKRWVESREVTDWKRVK